LSFDGKVKKVPEHRRREEIPSHTTTYTLIVTDKNDRPVKCSPDNSVTVTVSIDPPTPTPTLPPTPPSPLPPLPSYPADLVSYYSFQQPEDDLGPDIPGLDHDTGLSTDQYLCGIAGFSTGIAQIASKEVMDPVFDLFVYPRAETNTWWIRADFAAIPYFSKDTEDWDVTLICLNRSYPDLILDWGHDFMDEENRVDTGISVQDYACGMFGFYIRNGDIDENGPGDILSAYLYDDGGTYHAYINFNAAPPPNQALGRRMNVLCVKQLNPDQVILDMTGYHSIGDNPDYSTRYSYDNYVCVPSGYAILNGDMNEEEPDVVVDLNLYAGNDRNWWIRGDFHSHHTDENWSVDLLCFWRGIVVGAP